MKSYYWQWTIGLLLAWMLIISDPPHAASDPIDTRSPPAVLTEDEKTAILDQSSELMLRYQTDSLRLFLEPHIEAARVATDSTFLLTLLVRTGSVLSGQGRILDSEPFLREAIALSEALADSQALCTSLRWLSFAETGQGENDEAIRLCERLLDVALLSDDPEHAGWASSGLAWQASRRGDHKEAADLNQAAIDYFARAQVPSGLAFALNALANSKFRLGLYDDALPLRRRAVEVARQIEFGPRRDYVLSNALNDLGVLEFNLGDPGTAAQHFLDAYEIHRQGGNTHGQIIPGINVAICETHLGRYSDAIERLEQLIGICEEQEYPELLGRAISQLLTIHRRQEQFGEAEALARRAMSMDDALTLRDQIEYRIQLGLLFASLERRSEAIEVMEEMLAQVSRSGEIEAELYLRTYLGIVLSETGRYRDAIRHLQHVDRESRRLGFRQFHMPALATVGMCYHALGDIDSAFVALDAATDLWEADRSVPLDPEWREQRGAEGRDLYTRIAALYLEHPEATPRTDRIRAAFGRIQVFKARTLLERMLGPGTAAETSHYGDLPDPPSVEVLQRDVLKPGELFIDMFVGETMGFLFAVTRSECRVMPLPTRKIISRKVSVLLSLISSPAPEDDLFDASQLERLCGSLGDQLLGEIEDLVGQSERILISADGALNLIPWALLVESSTLELEDSKQVRASKQVVLVPSAAFLSWQRGKGLNRDRGPAVGLLAIAATWDDNQRELLGAKSEVERLARSFDGVDAHFIDKGSEPIDDLLHGYEILHFAAHASVDDQHPWRSMVMLHPDSVDANPRADRIAGMRLPASLAVLSSCESAGGRVLSGEGVQGLTSAFLSAGVPTVLATLWKIDDRSTVRLIAHFYEELAAGQSAAVALGAAQAKMREDPSTRWPYYWAGFVLAGDAETGIALQRKRGLNGYLPGLLLLIAIGLTLLFRRRLKR